MVDFFTCHHWENLLHPAVHDCLLSCTEEELHSVKTVTEKLEKHTVDDVESSVNEYAINDLSIYLNSAKFCWIEQSKVLSNIAQFDTSLAVNDRDATTVEGIRKQVTTKEYMCAKKSHEVDEMAKLVANICQKLSVPDVVDIGSGKGYLGTFLSLKYQLNVVGIDCNESNSTIALSRSRKFVKYWNGLLRNKERKEFCEDNMKYTPITAHIDAQSDVNFTLEDATESVVLTGLHSCGDLSSTALRIFVKNPKIRATVIVGCCYHLLSSEESGEMEHGFPLSKYLQQKNFRMQRNTRMLGLKSMDRIESSDIEETEKKSTRSLFYRAVLSVILEREFGLDSSSKKVRVGKEYAKSKSFIDYIRRSLKKLKIPEQATNSLTDDSIVAYLHELEVKKKTLVAFNMLREAFGPVVEAVILLDRLLFLREQQRQCDMNCYLVRLFEPQLSPRCYALVALKAPS